MEHTAKLLKNIENNNVVLDHNFSIVATHKSDERDEIPLNYPGRICMGQGTKRAENIWWKTKLFSQGIVMVPELLKSRNMVCLESLDEASLPNDTNPNTHVKQSEKYHQLGPAVWHNVLETTIGTLPSREDASRSAVLVVDTHARTGEVAKAICQMISNMKAPLY